MFKQRTSLLFFCMALLLAIAVPVNATPVEPTVRVGLWSNQSSIIISADADFEIVNVYTKQSVGSFPAKAKVIIAADDTGILINNKAVHASNITVLVKDELAEHYVEVNKKWYRQKVEVFLAKEKNRLTVVNQLPLEEYLYGVVGKEISPDWPIEAIKAQAVAARTYALANIHKHESEGYDVCATSDCQVYGGRESEAPRIISAVDDTYGLIVTYQGKPINAYFFSSGGGYTENSENVWGSYVPYVRAVPDYDQNSPHYKWEKSITVQDLDAIIARMGYKIGPLEAIELSALTKPPVNAADRGISGRVKNLRLIGKNASMQISGEKFRNMLTLNSTLFDIKIISPIQKNLEFTVTDTAGQEEKKSVEINLPPNETSISIIDKANLRRITGSKNETIQISGAGYGHGLGMSQWGAKAMAEKAPKDNSEYFKEILQHYYQGVEIKKKY